MPLSVIEVPTISPPPPRLTAANLEHPNFQQLDNSPDTTTSKWIHEQKGYLTYYTSEGTRDMKPWCEVDGESSKAPLPSTAAFASPVLKPRVPTQTQADPVPAEVEQTAAELHRKDLGQLRTLSAVPPRAPVAKNDKKPTVQKPNKSHTEKREKNKESTTVKARPEKENEASGAEADEQEEQRARELNLHSEAIEA